MSEQPLSIVHFSTADIIGGSARSAYRIHTGLRAAGHRSRMLVGIKAGDDPDVETIQRGPISLFADRIANKVSDSLGLQYQFVPSCMTVANHPWVRNADVIQLYNTHGGYFSTFSNSPVWFGQELCVIQKPLTRLLRILTPANFRLKMKK